MNKQEILNQIDNLMKTIAETPFSTFMGYSHGENTAFTICRGLIEKLDEPQKVKVPPYMEEFLDFCMKEEQSGVDAYHGLLNICSSWPKEKILEWSFEDPYRFINAFQYGYEVASKYRVKIGNGYFIEFRGRGCLISPHETDGIMKFDAKSEAERIANITGGTVEPVEVAE